MYTEAYLDAENGNFYITASERLGMSKNTTTFWFGAVFEVLEQKYGYSRSNITLKKVKVA